jgi:peptidoglycan/xylan/chitin deacetylase (PgdA/CDA1 family)
MYHSICDELQPTHPYYETNTASDIFERQMKFLRKNGYHSVSLSEAWTIITDGSNGVKPVVITFDDGYLDFRSRAMPVLLKYGLRATVFVVTDFVRQSGIAHHAKRYMTWLDLREIHSAGMDIGSHTLSHPELHGMVWAQVERELRTSREIIEQQVQSPVSSFAYPHAFPEHDRGFVTMLRDCLEDSGYENGVCTMIGTASPAGDRFFLPRLPVNSHDDLRLFRAKLEGGYDWLHTPQRISKILLRRRTSASRPATVGSC